MWSPLVFKGELKNKKVASGAVFFFQSKGGLKHRREAEFPEGWQLLAVQKNPIIEIYLGTFQPRDFPYLPIYLIAICKI